MSQTVIPITIDNQRCNGCGVCVPVCHERAMTVRAGKITIDAELCSTCSQCIALCPERALSWQEIHAAPRKPELLPTPAQLDELLKERRSMRRFSAERLPRQLLTDIATAAAYAPTNNYELRVVIVDDPALLLTLESYARRRVSGVYRAVYKYPWLFELAQRVPFVTRTGPKDRVKVEGTVAGHHAIFHEAPAMLFVVGDARIALSNDSAQFALANVIFAAQARGIASCLSGAGKTLLTHHRQARRALGLASNERIYGVLTLGYPAMVFPNNVEGKALTVTWRGL